jgi:multidrug efflux pump
MIVAYRNGAPVRLTDVADVIDSAENTRLAAWAQRFGRGDRQHPAPARRQCHRGRGPDQAPAAAAAGVAAASIDVVMLTDRTVTIRASVRDVQFELMLAVALVVMIIFVFLRNVSATIIPQCRRAAVPDRHVCGDVSRRLLASTT